ncbi:hypothetical protein PtA15_7A765 [Puccinia triticina]|uniref:Uncharacterized protein n=1 Tax=Puccinia triticina TaxID=208348 RepID=A0ABY7CP58_9BASI|nr:uncharacterized protein PtA15_7A765 [Puccinia triticina]WAQ87036.1 hypothetical protein PtA15_7A765 [Puccinia triticina]
MLLPTLFIPLPTPTSLQQAQQQQQGFSANTSLHHNRLPSNATSNPTIGQQSWSL